MELGLSVDEYLHHLLTIGLCLLLSDQWRHAHRPDFAKSTLFHSILCCIIWHPHHRLWNSDLLHHHEEHSLRQQGR